MPTLGSGRSGSSTTRCPTVLIWPGSTSNGVKTAMATGPEPAPVAIAPVDITLSFFETATAKSEVSVVATESDASGPALPAGTTRGQLEVARDPSRFKVICCGSQWGKTLLGAALWVKTPRLAGRCGG